MVSNWVVGRLTDREGRMASKLKMAPFDCIVVVMSPAVAEEDENFRFFEDLHRDNPEQDPELAEVLGEKAVFRLSARVFVALHRAKIKQCKFRQWSIRSRGQGVQPDIDFGTLTLDMDNTRQRMKTIRIGILYAKPSARLTGVDMESLVDWIVMDRVAMLTGYFGDRREFVEDLASNANAISCDPLCQTVQVWDARRP